MVTRAEPRRSHAPNQDGHTHTHAFNNRFNAAEAAGSNSQAADGSATQPASTSGYIFDEASGYYYDPASGSHYDAKTGYYFVPSTQQWCSYDQVRAV
jgi:hypothetical protein